MGRYEAVRDILKSWILNNNLDAGRIQNGPAEGRKRVGAEAGEGSLALSKWDLNRDNEAFFVDNHRNAFAPFEPYSICSPKWFVSQDIFG